MLLLGCDCTCTIRVMAGAAGAVEVWWVGHGVGDSATTFVIVQGEVAALALVKARSLQLNVVEMPMDPHYGEGGSLEGC